MNHHNNNNIIIVATVSVFIVVFLCCKCSGDSHIHSGHGRLRRFFSSIEFDDTNEDEQRCDALCHEYSCRREYIQTRARYFLSCVSYIGDLSPYRCARHRNGTLCELLVQRYFTRNRYNYNYYGYSYPDSNRSCSYSECSSECSMILQQLKETWGCCFHAMVDSNEHHWEFRSNRNSGFTTRNHSHNYWLSCGIQPPEKCYYDITDITIDLAECSTMEQFYHLYTEYVCVSLPQFLREAKSCAYLYYRASALCAIKDGKRCQELLFFSNYTWNLFAKAGQDCSRTSDVCSLGCKSTLQFLRDHVGCCLNVDNGTNTDSIKNIYLRYGLWKSCGIEPPGQCASITTRLQPAGSGCHPVHGGLSSTVMVFIIIALFLY